MISYIFRSLLALKSNEGFLFQVIFGTYYDRILLLIFLVQLYLAQEPISIMCCFFSLLTSLLYTIHFIMVTTLYHSRMLRAKSDHKML